MFNGSNCDGDDDLLKELKGLKWFNTEDNHLAVDLTTHYSPLTQRVGKVSVEESKSLL